MASPRGCGGGGGGGNSRRYQQQQPLQHHSFEAPSPPRFPAAAAAALAQAQQQQQLQQQHFYDDTNNPLATLAAQLPVLAADPYYGALIGTLPAHVRARLERERGHQAGAATTGADVVTAAREHYYLSTQAVLSQEPGDTVRGASTTRGQGAVVGTTTSLQRQQEEHPAVAGSIVYINPKQYHRILVRRAARAREAAKGVGVPRSRNPYMHASRHEAALRRQRLRGKFLPKGASGGGAGGGGSGGGGGEINNGGRQGGS